MFLTSLFGDLYAKNRTLDYNQYVVTTPHADEQKSELANITFWRVG